MLIQPKQMNLKIQSRSSNMQDVVDYYFGGWILSVDAMTYLVRIRKSDSVRCENRIEDLPDWVFESRLAIWLMENEAPIFQRSIEGDRMRNLFLSRKVTDVK